MTDPPLATSKLAHWVHWALTAGIALSAVLLLTGLVVTFWTHEPRPEGVPEAGFELLRHALQGHGPAILNLGLLILMLTPALRVYVLAIGWFWERDWVFTAVALCVLALLSTSLFLGAS